MQRDAGMGTSSRKDSNEVERLLNKNSRAVVELQQLQDVLHKSQNEEGGGQGQVDLTQAQVEELRERIAALKKGMHRRLQILAGWCDLGVYEKRRMLDWGKVRRTKHLPQRGKDRLRTVELYTDIPASAYEAARLATKAHQDAMAKKHRGGLTLSSRPTTPGTAPKPKRYKTEASEGTRSVGGGGATQNPDTPFWARKSSSYPGVSLCKGKFNAQLNWNGKHYYMGRYEDELDAARAVQDGLTELETVGQLTLPRTRGEVVQLLLGKEGHPGRYWVKEVPPKEEMALPAFASATKGQNIFHPPPPPQPNVEPAPATGKN